MRHAAALSVATLLLCVGAAGAPDAGSIVLLGGGARTFLCCFDELVEKLAKPMEADLFAYFKTTEGKHQTWHHNESKLLAKLETYARFRGAVLVPRLDCEGDCLVAQVGCRKRFARHLGNDTALGRAIGQHALLERLGQELRTLEARRGARYEWVAWVRPDVVVQVRYPALADVASSVAMLPSCGGDVDMARVLPRDDAENLLFGGMAAARSACGIFATRACNRTNHRTAACNPFAFEAEDFVRRAVPHNRGCVRARPLRLASCPLLKS